jgi:ribosome recycling factor
MTKYAQVLDSADGLAIEEQESLVEVLQHRLTEHRRAELTEAVKSARREFKEGRIRPATSAQIVKRLFA